MQRGWYFIKSHNRLNGKLPRWTIALFDGERWFEPGKSEPDHANMLRTGPMIPYPVDFDDPHEDGSR